MRLVLPLGRGRVVLSPPVKEGNEFLPARREERKGRWATN